MKIKKLDPLLINKIAAGEVVERPSSVVKELIENSIDAESTRIIVNIEDYGKKLIQVIDNGYGMIREDALKAFEIHTTSKISNEMDLKNIRTLGFRGEALASISSVSEISIIETKNIDDKVGTTVEINENKITDRPSSKTESGTKISIHNLFEKIPARKKFLKSDNTEMRNIANTFIDLALINYTVIFELNHNGKNIYKLIGSKNLKERIFEIWGEKVTNKFYNEVEKQYTNCNIRLIIQDPNQAEKSSTHQYIFVNNRKIDSKVISTAIKEAYKGFIHRDLTPSYFINIHINPEDLDVNVHPRKSEVRFSDSQTIFSNVFNSVKKTLESISKENMLKSIENNEVQKYTNSFQNNFEDSFQPKTFKYEEAKEITGFTRKRFSNVKDAISFSSEIMNINDKLDIPKKRFRLTQYFNTYIVYEENESMIFIDQHAAAEKITFEKIIYSLGSIITKPLLIPTLVELQKFEKDQVLEECKKLKEIGIIIEDFGGNTIKVIEIPEIIERIDFNDYLRVILNNSEEFSHLKNEYADTQLSKEMYDLIALTACHGSIRAGQKLNEDEMQKIIDELNKLKNPNNCPHGRPILWKIKKTEIEKNFKRII